MMRKFGFYIALLVFLTSCVNQEKYYGEWVLSKHNDSVSNKIKITKDSIYLYPLESNYWKSFPLKITANTLSFLDSDFNARVNIDTLFFQSRIYIKDVERENLVKADLPNLEGFQFFKINKFDNYFFLGKRKDKNEFNLQINGEDAKIENLTGYLLSGYHHYNKTNLMFCDKNISMKKVEEVFLKLKIVQQHTIHLINDTNYPIKNDTLNQIFQGQPFRVSYFIDENYVNLIFGKKIIFPPPPPKFILPYTKNTHFFFLIDNHFYYKKEKITKDALIKMSSEIIINKETAFFLFDKDSTYDRFLEYTMCYHSPLNQLRENESQKKFKASYQDLEDENKMVIINTFPSSYFQGYSIDHFRSIEMFPNDAFEFPFYDIDSKIPDFYLEKGKK